MSACTLDHRCPHLRAGPANAARHRRFALPWPTHAIRLATAERPAGLPLRHPATAEKIVATGSGAPFHSGVTAQLLKSVQHAPSVVIEEVYPLVNGGRLPVKRVVGEPLTLWADIFKDGHDVVRAMLKWRRQGTSGWQETAMEPADNDRWSATYQFPEPGCWELTIEAWAEPWLTWRHGFKVKLDAGQQVEVEAEEGARLLESAAARAAGAGDGAAAEQLRRCAETTRSVPPGLAAGLLMSAELEALMLAWSDRTLATRYQPLVPVLVERERARFSAWYEFFPRSAFGDSARHAGFRDCVPRLEEAAAMGFDVIYFPPIHPIGVTNRKGRNNTVTPEPDDVGSPWAIGGPTGGHRSIEPALGTLDDFRWLIDQARSLGLEIALDFAINCSPDHPYVREHPDWFHQRPDGSIKYAENPPKKYQDIYPLNFHCADWRALWQELTDVVIYWARQGVRIFRVDNPHTKPVAFWEYLIPRVRETYPDVIFLSEAFTRPKMMQVLGKIGFSQSYTYFTWRESKQELTAYLEELTQGEMRWYYRGNFWPNTPDILPGHLQHAGPAMFKIRAALAATLLPSWGIYSGFELCENQPLEGREEYLDSEKYQLAGRDWNRPGNIKGFITRLNQLRRQLPALQLYDNLAFVPVSNDQLLAFRKTTPDGGHLLIVITLDPHHRQEGTVHLPLDEFGLPADGDYRLRDLMHERDYVWQGADNYVALDPGATMMHLFRFQS